MSTIMAHELDLEKLNERFEKSQPEEIIRWAIEEFRPKIALSSSFQTESVVLLHLVSLIDPSIPILFLETSWHFKETLDFKNEIVKRLGLTNVVDLKADPQKKQAFDAKTGGKPYEVDPDYCCQINKVEPLDEALKGYDAWISGIRRSQSKTRKDIKIVEEYQGGIFKINPLANVTSGDIWWYLKEHHLPKHPLFDKGYLSIGCWPCTRPVQPGDDERAGRWAGREKTECGIHTFMKPKPVQTEIESPAEKQEGSEI
ncbi:MAG: phosphoadenylyl-sulfate reductase [Candidatus Omnitrophica bacterium]|nr:phosphoadenylyl-sulfate reductase [Candidatus Omnitrophota bacterium]